MDVELVTHKMPAGRLGSSGHHRLHMRQKIFLRSGGTCIRCHHLSRHPITADNEGAGAVADIFKLAPLHFSRSQRQSWVLTQKAPGPRSVHPCSSSVLPLWPTLSPADRPDRSPQWFHLSAHQLVGSTSSESDAA